MSKSRLPSGGYRVLSGRRTNGVFVHGFLRAEWLIINASLTVQKASFFDRASALTTWYRAHTSIAVDVGSVGLDRRGQVRNVLGERVLRSNCRHTAFGCFASLGEGVVARVKVLAFLMVIRLQRTCVLGTVILGARDGLTLSLF